jgi:hypothetical protein
MTVNSTSDSEMSISLLATLAYRKAGLVHMTQTPHSDQLTAAYQFLEVLVRRATVLGNQARFRGFDTVTLVSGTRQYNLAATTLDAVGDGLTHGSGEAVADGPKVAASVGAASPVVGTASFPVEAACVPPG